MTQKKLAAEQKEIELESDAWPRFERFIRNIAKAGPQHRAAKAKGKAGRSPSARKAKSQI